MTPNVFSSNSTQDTVDSGVEVHSNSSHKGQSIQRSGSDVNPEKLKRALTDDKGIFSREELSQFEMFPKDTYDCLPVLVVKSSLTDRPVLVDLISAQLGSISWIKDAESIGRLIRITCDKENRDYIEYFKFFIAKHVSCIFDGSCVDGIKFKSLQGQSITSMIREPSIDSTLKDWLLDFKDSEDPVDELMRLTNCWLDADNETRPVIAMEHADLYTEDTSLQNHFTNNRYNQCCRALMTLSLCKPKPIVILSAKSLKKFTFLNEKSKFNVMVVDLKD